MSMKEKWKQWWKIQTGDVNQVIKRIQQQTAKVDVDSDEFRRLRQSLEQEYKNKKLVKEMRRGGLSWDKVAMITMVLAIAIFGFALDLESPKAMKIAAFVLKLPGIKL